MVLKIIWYKYRAILQFTPTKNIFFTNSILDHVDHNKHIKVSELKKIKHGNFIYVLSNLEITEFINLTLKLEI